MSINTFFQSDAMTMSTVCGLYSSQVASSLIAGFPRFSHVTLPWPLYELITKLIIVPVTQLTVDFLLTYIFTF